MKGNMPQFEFLEDEHIYKLDGIVIPGVSNILSPLSDFSGVHPDFMKQACEFGNHVHKAVELYLSGELDEENLDPHLKNIVEQFKVWKEENIKFHFSEAIVEKPSFHPGLKYAGTPDMVFVYDAIIDFKTRKTDPIKDILQLSAYEAFYGKPGTHRLIVLELYEDRYKEVDLSNHKLRKQAFPLFRYLLDDWHRRAEMAAKIAGWKNKGR